MLPSYKCGENVPPYHIYVYQKPWYLARLMKKYFMSVYRNKG